MIKMMVENGAIRNFMSPVKELAEDPSFNNTSDSAVDVMGPIPTAREVQAEDYFDPDDLISDSKEDPGTRGVWDVDGPDKIEQPSSPSQSLWECVHPCALLVRLCGPTTDKEILRTLDGWGYLDKETGRPDVDLANKEYERWACRR
jgi:hypothetical protein